MTQKNKLPDMVILSADYVAPTNGVLLTWRAGVPITDKASIQMLCAANAPAKHFIEVTK